MKYRNIREEELKNKVGKDYFFDYDSTQIIGNIDFSVTPKTKEKKQHKAFEEHSLLWAEAKIGSFDLIAMFTQLILTIGKARTFDKNLPPAFLGAFDFQKIAFLPYEKVQHLFFKNDFNWNVTSSNHESKEFKEIHALIETILKSDKYEYQFGEDDKELQFFIKNNIAKATESGKIQIDKNNFAPIYLRWLDVVKPLINFDFEEAKKQNIFDSDFYLADLFVDDHDTASTDDDTPLKEELFIVFKNGRYEIAKEKIKLLFSVTIDLIDKNAYEQFWKRYKRPPINEFHNYIIERRDLLVPQDIRERKGAFFTPFQWVELSQKYLADVLGKDWQEEYYVWDCAAGTGNLLAGLTNKFNIWASTLDQADVNVMHDRIENGANLLKTNVFQFDFLNDDFSKLPKELQNIINDENKRKKLVIYINPPYAEVSSKAEKGKVGVNLTKTHKKYGDILGTAGRELFAQFLIRAYSEFNGVILAEFSTIKVLQGSAFITLKEHFQAKLEKIFLAPADTFDNVKGQFPIGFKIWNTNKKAIFKNIIADVYDKNANLIATKGIYPHDKSQYINKWISVYKTTNKDNVGYMDGINGNDFQHNNIVYILNTKEQLPNPRGIWVNQYNLIPISIYLAVRKCINATWLNDRDQFLYPNDDWKKDKVFQNDCLAFTLFNNNIQTKFGINHWIPFTEQEVDAKTKFASNFITDFIKGKLKPIKKTNELLFNETTETFVHDGKALKFSKEATAVFDAGRVLWNYYHSQKFTSLKVEVLKALNEKYNANVSLYDIKEHFQGRSDKGRMNSKSKDAKYNELINNLRDKLIVLAKKIEPKVYEYGFLKE